MGPNTFCEDFSRNGGDHNSTKWIGITPTPFAVEKEPPERSKVQCKICCSTPLCLIGCCAIIICTHTQHPIMSFARIHLGVHNHVVFIGMCCESLDMAF